MNKSKQNFHQNANFRFASKASGNVRHHHFTKITDELSNQCKKFDRFHFGLCYRCHNCPFVKRCQKFQRKFWHFVSKCCDRCVQHSLCNHRLENVKIIRVHKWAGRHYNWKWVENLTKPIKTSNCMCTQDLEKIKGCRNCTMTLAKNWKNGSNFSTLDF